MQKIEGNLLKKYANYIAVRKSGEVLSMEMIVKKIEYRLAGESLIG
jgi:hypothetical protein